MADKHPHSSPKGGVTCWLNVLLTPYWWLCYDNRCVRLMSPTADGGNAYRTALYCTVPIWPGCQAAQGV